MFFWQTVNVCLFNTKWFSHYQKWYFTVNVKGKKNIETDYDQCRKKPRTWLMTSYFPVIFLLPCYNETAAITTLHALNKMSENANSAVSIPNILIEVWLQLSQGISSQHCHGFLCCCIFLTYRRIKHFFIVSHENYWFLSIHGFNSIFTWNYLLLEKQTITMKMKKYDKY